jgi:hypothetical protein
MNEKPDKSKAKAHMATFAVSIAAYAAIIPAPDTVLPGDEIAAYHPHNRRG